MDGRMEAEAPTPGEEPAILGYLRKHAMQGTREEALPDPRQRAALTGTHGGSG
jgi:hypothetical protein